MSIQAFVGVLLCIVLFVGTASMQKTQRAAYGILLDNTGTLRPELDAVKKVGKAIVEQVNMQGEISVFSFSTLAANKENVAKPAQGSGWGQAAHDL